MDQQLLQTSVIKQLEQGCKMGLSFSLIDVGSVFSACDFFISCCRMGMIWNTCTAQQMLRIKLHLMPDTEQVVQSCRMWLSYWTTCFREQPLQTSQRSSISCESMQGACKQRCAQSVLM